MRAPRIVIRTDASSRMGSGHVMRCLTLASELRARGANVSFVSRERPGHLCEAIEKQGFKVHRLPPGLEVEATGLPGVAEEDLYWLGVPLEQEVAEVRDVLSGELGVDWLIVDHYGLDHVWEGAMRRGVERIGVIDDLADRLHDADVLLDQNLCAGLETRYRGLVPVRCRTMLGPRYALLRPEFAQAKKALSTRDGTIRRVLVFYGGGDAKDETGKALEVFSRLNRQEILVDVVVGASNPNLVALRARCERMPKVTLHVTVSHMAELMARANLALGGGGTATWERCTLGLPTLITTLANNQVPPVSAVAAAGGAWSLGPSETVSVERLASELSRILDSPQEVAEVSRRAMAIMAGHGEGQSLSSVLMEACRAHG